MGRVACADCAVDADGKLGWKWLSRFGRSVGSRGPSAAPQDDTYSGSGGGCGSGWMSGSFGDASGRHLFGGGGGVGGLLRFLLWQLLCRCPALLVTLHSLHETLRSDACPDTWRDVF
jgi:uncharacterized membrane protein